MCNCCTKNCHPIRPQFCTCHNSWAVVACAKLWPDWILEIKMRAFFCNISIMNWTLCEKGLQCRGMTAFGYEWKKWYISQRVIYLLLKYCENMLLSFRFPWSFLTRILTKHIPYFTHECEVWGVLCEFIVWSLSGLHFFSSCFISSLVIMDCLIKRFYLAYFVRLYTIMKLANNIRVSCFLILNIFYCNRVIFECQYDVAVAPS